MSTTTKFHNNRKTQCPGKQLFKNPSTHHFTMAKSRKQTTQESITWHKKLNYQSNSPLLLRQWKNKFLIKHLSQVIYWNITWIGDRSSSIDFKRLNYLCCRMSRFRKLMNPMFKQARTRWQGSKICKGVLWIKVHLETNRYKKSNTLTKLKTSKEPETIAPTTLAKTD